MDGMIGSSDGGHNVAEIKGSIIGFRRWVVINGILCSPHQPSNQWEKGINTAKCFGSKHPQKKVAQTKSVFSEIFNNLVGGNTLMVSEKSKPAEVPHSDCTCGLYAYRGYESLYADQIHQGEVVGAVLMWGRIEVHKTGFRAEKALPVLLVDDHRLKINLKKVASEYSMQLVPYGQLMQKAKKIGHVYSDQEWQTMLGENETSY